MNENNKIALVTGASRGIGKAIAEQLGKQGCVVIGTATTESGAAAVSAHFAAAGIQGEGMTADVANAESVSTLINAITDKYGSPTVLVNNAGITRDNLLLRMKEEEWNAVINTNLNAMYRVCKACLKGMTKARWGRIINISSVVGSSGNAGQSNYAASKAGIEGFTRSLAAEVGSRGITANAVAPGFIDTDMTRELPEKQTQQLLSHVPLGRFGEAAEVAAAVGFLAGDGGAYISGETLHVNGGMYMG
ncbi:MAG: 3-oxoacyl-ACP reductase FabG [Pseudohongiellaceae bacterium]